MLLDSSPELMATKENWYKLMKIRLEIKTCYEAQTYENLERLTRRAGSFLLDNNLKSFENIKKLPDGKMKKFKLLELFALDNKELEILLSIL